MNPKIYRAIPEFSNYEINGFGAVRSIATGKIQHPKKDNPVQVQLYDDNGKRRRIKYLEVATSIFRNPTKKTKKSKPNYIGVSPSRMNPNRIPKQSDATPEEIASIDEKAVHFSMSCYYSENARIFILIYHFGLSYRLTACLLDMNIESINGKYYRAKVNPDFVNDCKKIIEDENL